MELIRNNKNKIIVGLLIVVVIVLLFDNVFVSNGADRTAIAYVEYMLDGDAKKCTALMCDDLIDVAGYETKKLFINEFDKTLDAMIDSYKDKYGNRWSYKVTVIDSFAVDAFDAFDYSLDYEEEGKLVKVVLEVTHKGGGLFKETDGTETFELIMKNDNGDWLVYDLIV